MKSTLNSEYLAERTSKILIKSDLLTTRAMVGLASLLFSIILAYNYFQEFHVHDLFWIVFSLLHACVTFFALYTARTNWFTFIGEAVCGFVLWNYIGISILVAIGHIDNVGIPFSAALAPFAPTFIAGISTWWILSRYPKITKK